MNGILTGRLSGTVKHIFHYLLVILIIGLTTLVCLPLSSPQSYHIVSFILLFVVAILAVFLGIGPVLLASTMSAVSWNYFFIPPFHTFHIANTEDRLMFVSPSSLCSTGYSPTGSGDRRGLSATGRIRQMPCSA